MLLLSASQSDRTAVTAWAQPVAPAHAAIVALVAIAFNAADIASSMGLVCSPSPCRWVRNAGSLLHQRCAALLVAKDQEIRRPQRQAERRGARCVIDMGKY